MDTLHKDLSTFYCCRWHKFALTLLSLGEMVLGCKTTNEVKTKRNTTKENSYFITMATLSLLELLTASCRSTIQWEHIVVVPWQQCLTEQKYYKLTVVFPCVRYSSFVFPYFSTSYVNTLQCYVIHLFPSLF